ncbi:peptidyl-prolyl cis-trans isomerase Pin1 [Teratosphaeriaceae sp. CCFEE 6253]|nr:peptidyl-prolyl cis-trans isomerase Pin1 [Teratosphaeriaceae sp. CCFEE 6253]
MATGLPAGWEVRHSNSKNLPYYFNPATKESRWEPPAETDSETLKHYMGQYHTTNLRADGGAAAAPQDLGGKIRCAHLLVKHRDSRRAASWRQADITRSKEEAWGIIRNYEGRIKNGSTSLGDLATTESDCPSARKRGDLGFFGRGEMQKEFEEASFVLKPSEVSPVIETASGLHIIERYVPTLSLASTGSAASPSIARGNTQILRARPPVYRGLFR